MSNSPVQNAYKHINKLRRLGLDAPEIVRRCRDMLMEEHQLTLRRANLVTMQVYSDVECGGLPGGYYIDPALTTASLVMMRTPEGKHIGFTLTDLIGFHHQCGQGYIDLDAPAPAPAKPPVTAH